MMTGQAQDLLDRGIIAAKKGEKESARFLLHWALDTDITPKQRTLAWLWLSQVSRDQDERAIYLQKVLTREPDPPFALTVLEQLNHSPENVQLVDPQNQIPSEGIDFQRFSCPRCGNNLTSKGKVLICDACGSDFPVEQGDKGNWIPEDFFGHHAVADEKSQAVPQLTPCLVCSGCGAFFFSTPGMMSFSCPYCASAYVLNQPESRDLYMPQAILPFTIQLSAAKQTLESYTRQNKIPAQIRICDLRGLYLPAWSFGLRVNVEGLPTGGSDQVGQNGEMYCNNIIIPGSHRLPEPILDEFDQFDLSQLVAYGPDFLADKYAEIYQVPLLDASRDAKTKAMRYIREQFAFLSQGSGRPSSIHIDAGVESFKLVLLPFWLSQYSEQDKKHTLLVNGQKSRVRIY